MTASAVPEPREGTRVRDALGRIWIRRDGAYGGPGAANWISEADDPERPSDPESWVKVAGNYGPVVILDGADEIKQSSIRVTVARNVRMARLECPVHADTCAHPCRFVRALSGYPSESVGAAIAGVADTYDEQGVGIWWREWIAQGPIERARRLCWATTRAAPFADAPSEPPEAPTTPAGWHNVHVRRDDIEKTDE